MILDTILRWVWISIAFLLSAFVAIVALFALGSLWTGAALRESAETHGDWIIWHGSDVFGAVFFTSAVLPALTAVPAVAAVLVGELFHIRSGLYYTLAGGAALVAIPLLAGASEGADPAALPSAPLTAVFASAGFVAGCIPAARAYRQALADGLMVRT